jgi:two-component system response regulator WspF
MRIAIVNDAAIAAEALRRFLATSGYELAWIARDGAEAVQRCRRDTPDLILMDLLMPVMDGVESTRQIMAQTPCPILVVTASIEGNSAKVFEALGAGALDVVQTPVITGAGQGQGASALKFKIEAISRLVSEDNGYKHRDNHDDDEQWLHSTSGHPLVAIGASAGGPAALAGILSRLPGDFRAAIVIVQHVDPRFVPPMASWLNDQSGVSVRVAKQGDQPRPNTALIAGAEDHLVFVNERSLGYTRQPQNRYHHPSIDVFFESVVRNWRDNAAGVLLTGMGKDGAEGLKRMRNAGYLTIAQDAASCAIYGMPKAAAELNAATKILPIDQIAKELIEFVRSSNR